MEHDSVRSARPASTKIITACETKHGDAGAATAAKLDAVAAADSDAGVAVGSDVGAMPRLGVVPDDASMEAPGMGDPICKVGAVPGTGDAACDHGMLLCRGDVTYDASTKAVQVCEGPYRGQARVYQP